MAGTCNSVRCLPTSALSRAEVTGDFGSSLMRQSSKVRSTRRRESRRNERRAEERRNDKSRDCKFGSHQKCLHRVTEALQISTGDLVPARDEHCVNFNFNRNAFIIAAHHPPRSQLRIASAEMLAAGHVAELPNP
jgi:hypothetical protein